jgi:serine protease inhibitor
VSDSHPHFSPEHVIENREGETATGVAMSTVSAPQTFRADHPFVFRIRDNHSGALLPVGGTKNLVGDSGSN